MRAGGQCFGPPSAEDLREVIRQAMAPTYTLVTNPSKTGTGWTREENGWVCEEVHWEKVCGLSRATVIHRNPFQSRPGISGFSRLLLISRLHTVNQGTILINIPDPLKFQFKKIIKIGLPPSVGKDDRFTQYPFDVSEVKRSDAVGGQELRARTVDAVR